MSFYRMIILELDIWIDGSKEDLIDWKIQYRLASCWQAVVKELEKS